MSKLYTKCHDYQLKYIIDTFEVLDCKLDQSRDEIFVFQTRTAA